MKQLLIFLLLAGSAFAQEWNANTAPQINDREGDSLKRSNKILNDSRFNLNPLSVVLLETPLLFQAGPSEWNGGTAPQISDTPIFLLRRINKVLNDSRSGAFPLAMSGGGSSLPSMTGQSGKLLSNNGTIAEWIAAPAGTGDMLASLNLSDLVSKPTALTNLGGTTVGVNLFKLANPGAVTFLRINADNTVTARSADNFRTDLDLPTIGGNNTWTGNNDFSAGNTTLGPIVMPLVVNGGATPTVDAYGEFSSDNNLFGAGRGAALFHDGTSSTALVGVLVSDVPANLEVPTFNTDGTVDWKPVAPADATYIVQTANGSLSGEQALGSLATGIVKNTTTTGVLSIAKADEIEAAIFAADAGANDTYTATLAPAVTAYVTGAHYRFKANTANTGAATINLNALGAKTIVKVAGGITTALADNDIRAGQWVDVVYDGTNMQMQSLLGNSPAGGGGGSVATDTIFDANGDLAVGTGADTAARLALGAFGSGLTSDGATAVWKTPSNFIEFRDDFFSSSGAVEYGPWKKGGGTMSTIAENSDANHWGVIRFQSTSVAVQSWHNAVTSVRPEAAIAYIEWIIKTPETTAGSGTPALSDATNHYTLLIGLGDTTGALAQTDGIYFRYTNDVNGGEWELVAESNTVEIITDSNSAVAGATWYRLGMLITNAASVEFFVNGASVGSVLSGIPNGAGRTVGPLWMMNRDAGTAERNMYIDNFWLIAKPTTPR